MDKEGKNKVSNDVVKEIDYASLNKRITVMIIDYLIVVGCLLGLSRVFDATGVESGFIRVLPWFIFFFYEPILITYGVTIGQMAVGVRVRKVTGTEEKLSLAPAILRTIMKIGLGIFSFLYLAFNDKKKAFHDLAAKSVVVNLETGDEEFKVFGKIKLSRFKFAVVSILYILWVVWVGKWWLIFGLGVIFDMYITKKVNWTPWKKREGKNNVVVEWIDALIFAVIAVTFINTFFFQNYKIPTGSMEKSLLIGDHLYVSKVAYGPRIPNTPLSLPFTNNIMPLTEGKRESYLKWIHWDYYRLKGLRVIKNDDPVVFNYPSQDTAIRGKTDGNYYNFLRGQAMSMMQNDNAQEPFSYYMELARKEVFNKYDILIRPVDKRDNYIKRCVAIPGDSLQIIDGQVYINGHAQKEISGIQFSYYYYSDQISKLSSRLIERFDIGTNNVTYNPYLRKEAVHLNEKRVKQLQNTGLFDSIVRVVQPRGQWDYSVFPHDPRYPYNADNFGPIYIPEKGVTIDLSLENLPFYKRVIEAYEGNDLQIKDSTIFINGEKADTYTFKMDYYWMMGDNRHNSLDSRFWGYVPEDHIVGRPVFVWLSLDKEQGGIRWNRMFMGIK